MNFTKSTLLRRYPHRLLWANSWGFLKMWPPFLAVMTCFLSSGCATHTVSDIPETIRVGVYAMVDASHAGRFDLAQQYGDNLLRIIPAPKVRLHFFPVLRTVPPSANAPTGTLATQERVNVTPPDAAKLTVSLPEVSLLLSTPGAVAEQAQAEAYAKQVDAQQAEDAKDKSDAIAKVESDKVALAAQAKWKYMVLAFVGFVVVAVIGYVAWKLKWVGL